MLASLEFQVSQPFSAPPKLSVALGLAAGFGFCLTLRTVRLVSTSLMFAYHPCNHTTLLAPRLNQLVADCDHLLDAREPDESAPRVPNCLLKDVGRVFGELNRHRLVEFLGVLDRPGHLQRHSQRRNSHLDLIKLRRPKTRLNFGLQLGQSSERNELPDWPGQ